jgi:hypothetical protein
MVLAHLIGFTEFPKALGRVQGIGFFMVKIGHFIGYHPVCLSLLIFETPYM